MTARIQLVGGNLVYAETFDSAPIWFTYGGNSKDSRQEVWKPLDFAEKGGTAVDNLVLCDLCRVNGGRLYWKTKTRWNKCFQPVSAVGC